MEPDEQDVVVAQGVAQGVPVGQAVGAGRAELVATERRGDEDDALAGGMA